MKLLPFAFGILLGIWLVSLLGCNDGTTIPNDPMEEIADFVKQDQGRRLFRYSEDGNNPEEEEQWTRIQQGEHPSQFTNTEVYNTFQINEEETEYYVQQFSLDLADSLNRFLVRDFQFLKSKDSTHLISNTEYEGKLVGQEIYQINEKEVTLFKILGYAHIGDPEPSHHKYWHPEIGTVLIWYGEERFFELISPSYPFILNLKDKVIKRQKSGVKKK